MSSTSVGYSFLYVGIVGGADDFSEKLLLAHKHGANSLLHALRYTADLERGIVCSLRTGLLTFEKHRAIAIYSLHHNAMSFVITAAKVIFREKRSSRGRKLSLQALFSIRLRPTMGAQTRLAVFLPRFLLVTGFVAFLLALLYHLAEPLHDGGILVRRTPSDLCLPGLSAASRRR